MSRELYEDLQTTPASGLLNVDKLAFRFAHTRLVMDNVVNWDPAIVASVKEAIDR